MRIRKHAKVSPLVYAATSLKAGGSLPQPNLCQLNQSPWDVISFSSSDHYATPHLYQVDVDDSFPGNGSFGDSVGAVESVASLKLSCDDDSRKWVYSDGVAAAEGIGNGGANNVDIKDDVDEVLCCKSDEKGWQCKRRAKTGQALCEYHLSQLKTDRANTNSDQPVARKSEKGLEPPRRRPRPKKSPSASNPNDFYYYSGFGPRWGKRRGGGRDEPSKNNGNISRDDAENVGDVKPIGEPSSSSQIGDEEFDYSEDEDEEEEVEKKRARKPIKARSLKSLM